MAAQVAIAGRGKSFLPLAPRARLTAQACIAWGETSGDALTAWLTQMRGAAQFTLSFRAPAPALAEQSWLRARASLKQKHDTDLATVETCAAELLAPLDPSAWTLRRGPQGPLLDAVVACDANSAARALPALRSFGAKALAGWSVSLVGPLPLYSFAPEVAA